MSEEEIKKIAKKEFMNNVMKQLDSALIFTYIQNLENQLQQKENIIKEVREYIDRRDIEWGSDEHKHVLEMLDKVEETGRYEKV